MGTVQHQLKRSFLRLLDGRVLSYIHASPGIAKAGAPPHNVPTIINMHGWPSSAQMASLMSAHVTEAGFQLVCPDRPGIGGSSINHDLSFRSVASDMAQLLDHLGVKEGAIMMGFSGGGPYACACAALLGPKRVSALALLASMTHTWGPESQPLMRGMDLFNRLGYNCIAYLPPALLRWSIQAAALLSSYVVLPVLQGLSGRKTPAYETADLAPQPVLPPPADLSMSGSLGFSPGLSSVVPHLVDMLSDNLGPRSHGGLGFFQDVQLTCAPWNEFQLSQIQVPTAVFQGTEDTCVPLAMSEWLTARIPGASAASHDSEVVTKQRMDAPGGVEKADAMQGKSNPYLNQGRGLHVYLSEGHVSLILRRMPEIMQMVHRLYHASQNNPKVGTESDEW